MTNTEKIFSFIDTYAQSSNALYLEAVIDACNEWLTGSSTPDLSTPATHEEIRRGIQLAILKGMKESAQPNHQMTPDSIGMLLGHIASKLVSENGETSLLDPTVGTGNLLYTVMNMMNGNVTAYAVEIDEVLVRLSAVVAEILEQRVTFLVQDALRPLFIDPVDMVISDLPVGYYPDDENGLNYELMPPEGHAYAHHLFIEQSLNHTKDGGYALFVIPSNLFESEQASQLHGFLKNKAIIRAVIQLPSTLFKSEVHEKSILILQKPSEEIIAIPEVLLAKVPDMKNKHAMARFLQDIDEWAEKES
ncbi:class I SAM-dependent methyltransferase [Sporosarcina pasteurii]|uniref:Type I restriction-modification system methyltransferase subunit n=1 Tax=Sporosarcina pasteurii TaxID=1474 RepID=A0A380C667_SPOPA|nr:class I SAM-dependent methyltransferase [Sporosarcina pasteurii]MDS9471751.1 class I SAM-dependent methyltransferase [Sporosarcina pasteurii]QBQ04651.1 class I SAM-dependent methyltransferase [Sporosarcina pasteurii]SUJ13131.1 Type I restriction-modification system methyltransferase subunit [Sporosarcina pasteurii]